MGETPRRSGSRRLRWPIVVSLVKWQGISFSYMVECTSRMDILTPAERSERMSRVRSKDTKPEMAVRRLVHSLGYRYRLHARDLPGNPDMVFRPRRKVIFVHGCFWHRHKGCSNTTTPRSRFRFWQDKFDYNLRRDARNRRKLQEEGWSVLVIWECQVGDVDKLTERLKRFLDD